MLGTRTTAHANIERCDHICKARRFVWQQEAVKYDVLNSITQPTAHVEKKLINSKEASKQATKNKQTKKFNTSNMKNNNIAVPNVQEISFLSADLCYFRRANKITIKQWNKQASLYAYTAARHRNDAHW